MRLSSRLISNAASTYTRLGTTFILGIFYIWFLLGQIGIAAFGIIALSAGSFGLSFAIERTITFSLSRELSAAIATGERSRIRKTFVSSMALCALGAVILMFFSAGLAGLAWLGVFNLPDAMPRLPGALALLFLSEGFHSAVRLGLAPYQQSLFASQRIGMDNILRVLHRLMNVLAAVLAFGVLWPTEALYVQLYGFAAVRAVAMTVDVLVAVWLARRIIPGLEMKLSAFDRAEFKSVVGTCWHTGQMMILMEFGTYFMALLINLFFGVTYNGIWQIVVQIGGHAMLVAEGILQGIDPLSAHLKESGRKDTILDLMQRSIRYQLSFALPWIVSYIVFMTPILHLWIGGRLANDDGLIAAGITVTDAIQLIAFLANMYLLAILCRVATRGVERSLYGLGEVRSYAWFAKYAASIVLVFGAIIFWIDGSPRFAAVPFIFTNFLYFEVIVLRAARDRVGFNVTQALRASLPRPLLAIFFYAIPLAGLRLLFPELNLVFLALVVLGLGIAYTPLFFGVVLLPEERQRVRELMSGSIRKYRDR